MNEKITQLANQAEIQLDYFGYGTCEDGGNPNIQEFAELLIKECAEVAESKAILDHFNIQ